MSSSDKFDDFNVVEFLDENDIYYRSDGKNVSDGWIAVKCPFCMGNGEHGGINLDNKAFSCFQCATTARPPKYVRAFLDCGWAEAFRVAKKHANDRSIKNEREEVIYAQSVKLPGGPLNKMSTEYLTRRGYSIPSLVRKFRIQCTSTLDEWKCRIIIPVITGRAVTSYIGRDYTGKQELKYRALENEKSIIPVKHSLYNIDTVKDRVIIVEGTTDVWRMGDETIALFGLTMSPDQLRMLFQKRLKKAIILLDEGTDNRTSQIAHELAPFIPVVKTVVLGGGDPGDLSYQEAMQLKTELFSARS